MKFRLTEDILNEDALYRVSPIGIKNSLFFFLAGSNLLRRKSFATCRDVYDYINNTLKTSCKELVDDKLLQDLYNLGTTPVYVSPAPISSKGNSHYSHRTINSTYRQSRDKSHNIVASHLTTIDSKLFDDLTVHHLDGTEWNDDPNNLVGLHDDTIHQLAHLLNLSYTGPGQLYGTRRFTAAVYDGTKFVCKPCRVTIDIR